MKALIAAQLRSEMRDRTLLARSFPFVGIVLLLFAFAFDPDRGVLERIAPGLWWVVVLFASLFIFVRDAHNKKETRFISQFGIDATTVFLSRVVVNFILTFIITVVSGAGILFLFSTTVPNFAAIALVISLTTLALSAIGSIYAPLVAKMHDAGQLLSVVVIPIILPALLASIQATEAILAHDTQAFWQWSGLLGVFAILYCAAGALSADSLED